MDGVVLVPSLTGLRVFLYDGEVKLCVPSGGASSVFRKLASKEGRVTIEESSEL